MRPFLLHGLNVLNVAFLKRLRLRSKTHVLGSRVPKGKPQDRLRFGALLGKTLAFKKCAAIICYDLEASLGARACVQVLCVQKNAAFGVCIVKPTKCMSGRGAVDSSSKHMSKGPRGQC